MTKTKKICPRCTGNGYIRIPNEAVGISKEVVTQCTMCDSQGEVHYYEEPNYDYNGINTDKLQWDTNTI